MSEITTTLGELVGSFDSLVALIGKEIPISYGFMLGEIAEVVLKKKQAERIALDATPVTVPGKQIDQAVIEGWSISIAPLHIINLKNG